MLRHQLVTQHPDLQLISGLITLSLTVFKWFRVLSRKAVWLSHIDFFCGMGLAVNITQGSVSWASWCVIHMASQPIFREIILLEEGILVVVSPKLTLQHHHHHPRVLLKSLKVVKIGYMMYLNIRILRRCKIF